MNLACALTWLRIALTPVFALVFFWESRWGALLALALVIVSELTDLFDGMAARKMNQVTDLGKILDPFADSISRLTVFVCFACAGIVPMFFVLLILYRDSLVSTIRTVCAHKGQVVAARATGKIKAIVQATAIISILVLRASAPLEEINAPTAHTFWLMAIATAVTVYSAFDYLAGNWKTLGLAGGR
ncbi:MAG: putative CDP-diacylglycerol--glycerol-3-phosphate 3-phosphatidyl-transferase 2 [candidate division BRC1 bacterium ADurb.BinA364]|nr:MAG: putative CDP-diacylglycerol--glycerol-3-phosphate 3-phosphatidyl-transferase 2 [candidate division BRC1 bacterium ADurb.BinA364]